MDELVRNREGTEKEQRRNREETGGSMDREKIEHDKDKTETTDFFLRKSTIIVTVTAVVILSLCVAVTVGSRITGKQKIKNRVETAEELLTDAGKEAKESENTEVPKNAGESESVEEPENAGESENTEVPKNTGESESAEVPESTGESESAGAPEETENPAPAAGSEIGLIGEAETYVDPNTEPVTGMRFTPVSDIVTPFETVNLRTLPTKEQAGDIVYVLTNGEKAERTGINEETGWSRVLFKGRVCFAASEYLTTDFDDHEPLSVQEDGGNVEIKTTFAVVDEMVTPKIEVNLRRLPSVTDPRAEVAATIYAGEIVHRTGINTDVGWSRVEYHGLTLYCVSSYVEPVTE